MWLCPVCLILLVLQASRGEKFFGCHLSTFSGYIFRLRGYHSVTEGLPGSEQGLLPNSFYYAPQDLVRVMHQYSPLPNDRLFWAREWPTCWRDIDLSIGILPTQVQSR
jgi:hypothetical protein